MKRTCTRSDWMALMPISPSMFEVCGATARTTRGALGKRPTMRQPMAPSINLPNPASSQWPRRGT